MAETRLAELTTLRVGGPARRLVAPETADELVARLIECDRERTPVLLLGGGSNLVVADEGFAGTVVAVRTRGVRHRELGERVVEVTAAAGERWDAFVADRLGEGLVGLEALSGIPGSVGATPVQNVGAYGAQVADAISRVSVLDRTSGRRGELSALDCEFGYRTSRLKREPGRYLVTSVTFRLRAEPWSAPVRYRELAARLGVGAGERADPGEVRAAVLEIRARKGMVLDESDHDTWSAGSFFTNPVLDEAAAAALPADAPRFASAAGVKTSAAWLIQRAGFAPGHGVGPARLSTKHVLAITNRGSAEAADVMALAREVRDGVRTGLGVELSCEPALVGLSL